MSAAQGKAGNAAAEYEQQARQAISESKEAVQDAAKNREHLRGYFEKSQKLSEKDKKRFGEQLNEWHNAGDKASMRKAGVSENENDPSKTPDGYLLRHAKLASAFVTWDQKGERLGGSIDFHGNETAEHKIGLGDILPPEVKAVKVKKMGGETVDCVRAQNPQTGRIGYFRTEGLSKVPPLYEYVAIHTGDDFQISGTVDSKAPTAQRAILREHLAVYKQDAANASDGEELLYDDRGAPLPGTAAEKHARERARVSESAGRQLSGIQQSLGIPGARPATSATLSTSMEAGGQTVEINGKRYQKLTRGFLEQHIGTTAETTSRSLVETAFLGQRLRVSPFALPYLKEAESRIKAAGINFQLNPAAGGIQCYNFRGIRQLNGSTSNTLSKHSFGVAFDINPGDAPFGRRWEQINSPRKIPMEVVKIMQECGFLWGNDFANADPMHFELIVNPFTSQDILKSDEAKRSADVLETFGGSLGNNTRQGWKTAKAAPRSPTQQKTALGEAPNAAPGLANNIKSSTDRWRPTVEQMCEKYGIKEFVNLVLAFMFNESKGNPNAVGRNTNGTVDQGLMQLNSAYFKGPSIMDPATNIELGTKSIAELVKRYGGKIENVIMAYNCGHAPHEGLIPTSTKNIYLPAVLKSYQALEAGSQKA